MADVKSLFAICTEVPLWLWYYSVLQFRRRFDGRSVGQVVEAKVRVILLLPERHVVVCRTGVSAVQVVAPTTANNRLHTLYTTFASIMSVCYSFTVNMTLDHLRENIVQGTKTLKKNYFKDKVRKNQTDEQI